MRTECDAHADRMRCGDAIPMRTRCNVTGRYGTERKNHQDPDENPSVPDAPGSVDNRKPSRLEGWEERVREMDRAGRSLREIALAFGVSTKTATRWRARLGLNKAAAHVARPQEDRDRAEALLDDGCSFQEAARSVGVTGPTIRRWFPDRAAWTPQESGTHAIQVRRLGGAA